MDAERFTDIFSRLQSRLRLVARRIVGSDDEAADAVQDVFCTLWKRREEVADNGSLEGMMAVSVRNRCLNEVRRRSLHPEAQLEESSYASSSDADPESLFREVQTLMEQSLSERDREILLLRDHSGWEFDEIAERFDMTPAAVRMALSRARKGVLKAYRERAGNRSVSKEKS